MDEALLNRAVNEGFSGGEKKRNEIFQMAVLEPKLAILDETDSGLDIDALKIVADGVNALRSPDRAIIAGDPLPAAARTTSCPTSCTCWPTAGSSSRAARNWRWSSKRRATAGSRRTARRPMAAALSEERSWPSCRADAEQHWPQTGGTRGRVRRSAPAAPAVVAAARCARAHWPASPIGFPTTHDEDWRFTNVAPHRAGRLSSWPGRRRSAVTRSQIAPFQLRRAGWPSWSSSTGTSRRSLSALGAAADGRRPGQPGRGAPRTIPDMCEPHLGRYADSEGHRLRGPEHGVLRRTAPSSICRAASVLEQPIHLLLPVGGWRRADGVASAACSSWRGDDSQADDRRRATSASTAAAISPTRSPRSSLGEAPSRPLQAAAAKAPRPSTSRTAAARSRARDTQFQFPLDRCWAARLVRNDVIAVLAGEGGDVTLNGLSSADGSQHWTTIRCIDHAQPHCTSHELYKGILDGRAHGVFNGKIIVPRTPRRPTPSRPTRPCCSPRRRRSTPSRSWRSSPTT